MSEEDVLEIEKLITSNLPFSLIGISPGFFKSPLPDYINNRHEGEGITKAFRFMDRLKYIK